MFYMLAACVAGMAGWSVDVAAQAPAGSPAPAKEIREFEVLLKGKPTGTTKFTIESLPDGRTVVTTDAVIRVNMVVFTYNYDFHGVDTWIGDRLVSFQSHGADGGKKFAVDGAVGPSGSQMTVNQKKSQGPAFLFTCNYWRLPPGLPKNQPLPTVDASTGATQNVPHRRRRAGRRYGGRRRSPCRGVPPDWRRRRHALGRTLKAASCANKASNRAMRPNCGSSKSRVRRVVPSIRPDSMLSKGRQPALRARQADDVSGTLAQTTCSTRTDDES